VRKNIIKQNDRGIRIRSNDNEVIKNIIINNFSEGIRVELENDTETPSSNNIISSNLILNNGQEGIRVEDSSSNLISKNIIKNNGFIKSDPEAIRDGLKLEKEAYENTLIKNFVFNNNGNGIYVEGGSTGNSIMRNIVFSNGDDIDDSFDLKDGNDDCISNEWKRNLFRTSNLECIE
jgi:parallel beta-helix repeat protein